MVIAALVATTSKEHDMSNHNPEEVAALRREIERKSAEQGGGKTPEQMAEEAVSAHAAKQAAMGFASDPPSKRSPVIGDPVFERDGHITRFPRMVDVAKIGGKAEKIIAEVAESGEPIFILRAKDIFSVMAVARYIGMLEEYGPDAHDMTVGATEQQNVMKAWQRANVERVRYPD